jgi:hypothetical protein
VPTPRCRARCEYAAKRFFKLRAVVERNAARCWWLAAKLLRAYRSGVPVPATALAPDVTRHDVNWGAEGARRHTEVAASNDGSALTLPNGPAGDAWAQGAVGVKSGKHFFSVTVTQTPLQRHVETTSRVLVVPVNRPPQQPAAHGKVHLGSASPPPFVYLN